MAAPSRSPREFRPRSKGSLRDCEIQERLLDDSEVEDIEIDSDEEGDPTYDPMHRPGEQLLLLPMPRDVGISDDSSDDDHSGNPNPYPRVPVFPEPVSRGISSCESSSDEDDNVPLSETQAKLKRDMFLRRWKHCDIFDPLPPSPIFIPPTNNITESKKPISYFEKYVGPEIFDTLAFCMNATFLQKKGRELNTTPEEMCIFFGCSLIISNLKFPRLKMYWSKQFRVPIIADSIPKNRFFLLRNNMKFVIDDDVTEAQKSANSFWKLQPLIESIRNGCLLNRRSQDVSIDEQMVPFWGKTKMRQFIRNKPNPCGLKNLVATTSDGLPLDFFLYEGKGSTILDTEDTDDLHIGGRMIVRLTENLPKGTSLYMDRYFTSEPLLDLLFSNGYRATGTVMKNRIPNNANLLADNVLRKRGRGSCDLVVRNDELMATTKWFDNKPVVLLSTEHGMSPKDTCQRWCKKDKKYVEVERPVVIKLYNEKMGGVDFLDRMISYYRMGYRTKKWSVRLTHHLFDFCTAASWIEYRDDEKTLGTAKKRVLDYFDFRMQIGEELIYTWNRITQGNTQNGDEPSSDEERPFPEKRRKITPNPSPSARKADTRHFPVISDKIGRCRVAGCKTNNARMFCPMCKVFLCLTQKRNCFKKYHM